MFNKVLTYLLTKFKALLVVQKTFYSMRSLLVLDI